MVRTMIVLAGVGALLCACDVDFASESGRVGFDAPAFHYPSPDKWPSGGPVAVGSEVCMQIDGYYPEDGSEYQETSLTGCFDLGHSGVGTLEGECLRLDAPGAATITLTRTAAACEAELGDDEVRLEAVALEDTRTSVEFELEELVRQSPDYDTPGFAYEDLVIPFGDPLPVVADVRIGLTPGLRRIDGADLVAWTDGDVVSPTLEVARTGGTDAASDDLRVELEVPAGETAELSVRTAEVMAPPVTLEAIDPGELTDLEIVPFVDRDGVVGALRALARDATGRPVRGVPAQWEVTEGDIVLDVSQDPDYAYPDAACHEAGDPPIEQDVTVSATLDGQVRTYQWHHVSSQCASDETPIDDISDDTVGCACSSDPARRGPWWLVLGLTLGAIRRRRPGPRRPR